MKNLFALASLALVLAGCSAVTDVSKVTTVARTDDGARPVAAITVQNISYSLFGCLPIASGETWKGECSYDERPSYNVEWFADNVSPEDNIASLKAALKVAGSNKVDNLVERSESWSAWSLWILWQRIETTTCTVLK